MRARVLVVEDEQEVASLIAAYLAREGFETVVCGSAESALEAEGAGRFDLVVLDLNLPGMDGFEALTKLKSYVDTKHIPVIALSANAMPHEVKRGLEAGFLQYLTKPIDVKEFLRTIDLFLTGAAQGESSKSSPPNSIA